MSLAIRALLGIQGIHQGKPARPGVNGQPLVPEQPVALKDGDFIQFGRMSVTFYGS